MILSVFKKFGLLLAGLTILSAPAASAQIELKFGHVGAPGSLFALSAEEFARVANERLGDRAQVTVFGSSQLGSDREMLQKLRLGTIDFSLPSSVMSTVSDEFGLFEMPYLVQNREHMRRIERDIFWSDIAPSVAPQGYRILAVWENGFRHITNNVRPIETPDDLQGIKLRTPSGTWRVRMFQSYGANPTPLSFSEVFVALQTGVMDGQENPLPQIASARFNEVQEYLSISGHVYTPAYVLVGEGRFASLPADVQEILTQAARDTQAFVYDTAARLEQELLQQLIDGGMAVNEVDKASFVAASAPIYEQFGNEVAGAAAMIETALGLAAGQ
ncbi:MAG: TRAP transporter substrate-binding protein [Inquilinus sp.]|nr:TRAP transporter substrate-binding protein [Inquilinus sp.]